MKSRESEQARPLTDFLVEDHRRLEALLHQAVAHVDQGAYAQFRAGLLRHIGMEEKILIPAAQIRRFITFKGEIDRQPD